MKYKLSKYLYVINKCDIVIIYNLFNKKIFAITNEKFKLLQDKNFSKLKQEKPHFFTAMEKLGVIIPESFNELDYIKMMSRKIIFGQEEYRLTINPTLECNFNCWYCYEQHNNGKMSKETMNAIVEHIKLKIKDKSLKYLNLSWFGGEPLLYFEEVLFPLAKELKILSIENDIIFTNSITTNGYLIDEKRNMSFQEIELNSFQITIDGNKETHNKIRFNKNDKKSFDTIINNINLLSENINNKILVRINYTQQSIKNIIDILPYFSEKAKKNIFFLFQQVWQETGIKTVSAEDYKIEFEKLGFQIKNNRINDSYYNCYADRVEQAVINYDGNVYKCTARDFVNQIPDGKLCENGGIEWDYNLISKRFGNTTFENKHCIVCDFLPVCMGPCSQKMIEVKETSDFSLICLKQGVKKVLDAEIDNYISTTLN
ncbi:MAG: radical SAM protein [Bacteroidales bacterium]|jgi:uncharacterized protein|nr:radical SAM protein [Bacteroidales bacterium]